MRRYASRLRRTVRSTERSDPGVRIQSRIALGARGPASDVSTVEAHASSIGDQVADDGSKQRRLSGAGGAKDAHDFTGLEGDIYPSQYLLSGPFDADTRCGDDRLLRHGPLATGTAPLTCVSDTLPVASSMRALSAVIQLWPRASLTPPRRSNTCRTRSTSTAGDSACTPRTSAVTPPDPRAHVTRGVYRRHVDSRAAHRHVTFGQRHGPRERSLSRHDVDIEMLGLKGDRVSTDPESPREPPGSERATRPESTRVL